MDSAAKIVKCMQTAASLSKLEIPSVKAVEHIIGISLKPAIVQLFNISDNKADEVVEHYKNTFLDNDSTPCPLFNGVRPTLITLQSKAQLGVATGKARRGLNRAWQMTNTGGFFQVSRCADEAESKPSSDMLSQILAHWQVDPREVVMIGDTIYDMQMAENIGMHRIAVSYGVHSKEQLLKHKPLKIIDNFEELLEFV